jgi:hypothetical protein
VKDLRSILISLYENLKGKARGFPYERITRSQLLDPELSTCWPVGRRNAFLGWLWLLLDVDIRVYALQAVAPLYKLFRVF